MCLDLFWHSVHLCRVHSLCLVKLHAAYAMHRCVVTGADGMQMQYSVTLTHMLIFMTPGGSCGVPLFYPLTALPSSKTPSL